MATLSGNTIRLHCIRLHGAWIQYLAKVATLLWLHDLTTLSGYAIWLYYVATAYCYTIWLHYLITHSCYSVTGNTIWLICLEDLPEWIWLHCLVTLSGCTSWLHCIWLRYLVKLYGCTIWLHYLATLPGYTVSGYTIWLHYPLRYVAILSDYTIHGR